MLLLEPSDLDGQRENEGALLTSRLYWCEG
jgi:hypothetical protein